MLLSINNRNTAMFHTIAYLLLSPASVKALVGTLEICLLQTIATRILNKNTIPIAGQRTHKFDISKYSTKKKKKR